MDIDRSGLAENDYTRGLSQELERLLQEKSVLEELKQKVEGIGKHLKVKSQERHSLAKELLQLANQSSSFSSENAGLRGVGGTANEPSIEDSLSWDFEGLDVNGDKRPQGSFLYQQFVERLIATYDEQIVAREKDIEHIRKEMARQAENAEAHARGYNTNHVQNGTLDQTTLVGAGGDDISLNPSAKIRELERINAELLGRVNVLVRQKEELLQVNHQWDDQYRQLKADKERLASELPQTSGRTREISQVQRQGPAPSEETRNLIQELTQRNEKLQEEMGRMLEEQKKRDGLWNSAQKMINAERSSRETAAQMKQVAEERVKQLQAQLEVEKQTQVFLKQEVERLATIGSPDNTANSSSMQSINMTEQIEMLKQQISVYADDFANERSDRERIQADREAQKERIKEYERDIPLLKEQVKAYRDDFDKERRDKERLQRLLRERNAAQLDFCGDGVERERRANRVLLRKLVAEKRENETLQRLAQEKMDEVERARDVIAVARTMADNAMNDLEVVDPTIRDVEEVNDVP